MFMAPSPPNVPRESIPLSRVLASSRYPDNLQIDRWMKRWMDEWLILAFIYENGWVDGFLPFPNISIYGISQWMDGWMDGWLNLLPHWTAGTILSFRSGLWECGRAGGVSERIIRLFCQCHHWKHPEGRGECNRYCPQTMTQAHVRFFYFFGGKNQQHCDTHFNLSILPCVCKRQSLKGVGGLRGLKGGSRAPNWVVKKCAAGARRPLRDGDPWYCEDTHVVANVL